MGIYNVELQETENGASKSQDVMLASAGRRSASSISFIENVGQTDLQVEYMLKGAGHGIYFTGQEVVFSAYGQAEQEGPVVNSVVRQSLVDANANPEIAPLGILPGIANFFMGSQSYTEVQTYEGIEYREVYEGINQKFTGNDDSLERIFIVEPGADPRQIEIEYSGVEEIKLLEDGTLVLETTLGELTESAPVAYQERDGQREYVEAEFEILESGNVGFKLGPYDPESALTIDPILEYSTFLGSSDTGSNLGDGNDAGYGIAVDSTGSVYITGQANSFDFPLTTIPNPPIDVDPSADPSPPNDLKNVLVTKLDPSGAVVYSTFFGGDDRDRANAIAVDINGAVYITGETESINFPFSEDAGPRDSPIPVFGELLGGSQDAFVVKLNPTGTQLDYSTYLGGSGRERGRAIAVDNEGAAYVTGFTDFDQSLTSRRFPTTNGALENDFQGGNGDAFVTKINPAGDELEYSTYLGGAGFDEGTGIAVDEDGSAYISGTTESEDFATSAAFEESNSGDGDAFVVKLSPDGSNREYATYIGGSGQEIAGGIALDEEGAAYITGVTASTNFPTTSRVPQPDYGGGSFDAFITKLNPAGDDLDYSTYIGGLGDEGIDTLPRASAGIAVDGAGSAFVVGSTAATDFPTTDGAQQSEFGGGNTDAFITKINPKGNALIYSSYFGGRGDDEGYGIAVDRNGVAYITGGTNSGNFPTAGNDAFQDTLAGANDAFAAKFVFEGVNVTEFGGSTDVTENGRADLFAVALNTPPTSNVTLVIQPGEDPDDTVVEPSILVFTPDNWDEPQIVAVQAVDDLLTEGTEISRITFRVGNTDDPNYQALDISPIAVNVTDNEPAVIVEDSVNVSEGGQTDSFTVVLNSRPLGEVTIALRARFAIGLSSDNQVTTEPSSLIFTSDNWDEPQTVRVTAVDDTIIEEESHGGAIELSASSDTDPTYGSGRVAFRVNGTFTSTLAAAIDENDSAEVIVSPTRGLTTTEDEETEEFTVVLSSQPTANVTIGLSSDNSDEGTVLPSELTFTPDNWDVAQQVTVTGVDDNLLDGNVDYNIITAAAESADSNYDGVDPDDVVVTNIDNNSAEIIVEPTGAAGGDRRLTTTEDGETDSFTVRLNSIPTADVTIDIRSDEPEEGTVSTDTLTFTPDNALSPQTVTVTGVDDNEFDEDVEYRIVTERAVSDDSNYNRFNPPDVEVTNIDTTPADVEITLSGDRIEVTEGSSTDSLTLVLTRPPTADVTVNIATDDRISTSSPEGTFTPDNWNRTQRVIVTAVDDGDVEGIHSGTISFDVSSDDPDYDGTAIDPLTATIIDNDGITDENDFITLENFGEDVQALQGNDTIIGGAGNDTINGNQGNDSISGRDGNDTIYGGKQNDTISGNDGADFLSGNRENDLIEGNSGNDILYGGKLNDTLDGGAGNDTLSGDLDKDILVGGTGNDVFVLPTHAAITDVTMADEVRDFQLLVDRVGLTEGLTQDDLILDGSGGGAGGDARATVIRIAGSDLILGVVTGVTPQDLDGRFVSVN